MPRKGSKVIGDKGPELPSSKAMRETEPKKGVGSRDGKKRSPAREAFAELTQAREQRVHHRNMAASFQARADEHTAKFEEADKRLKKAQEAAREFLGEEDEE